MGDVDYCDVITLSSGYWLAMQVLWACSQMRGKKIPRLLPNQKTLEPESHHYPHSCGPSSSTPQR